MSADISLIAAVAPNGVIGNGDSIPWHYPADLAHFKEVTTGHPVIMGRVTYESILDRLGHPLPDRTNIVLSSRDIDSEHAEVIIADSLELAIEAANADGDETAYVIGGESIYEQFLPLATELIITEIPEDYDGDTFWPGHDESEWEITGRKNLEGNLTVKVHTRVGDPDHLPS